MRSPIRLDALYRMAECGEFSRYNITADADLFGNIIEGPTLLPHFNNGRDFVIEQRHATGLLRCRQLAPMLGPTRVVGDVCELRRS